MALSCIISETKVDIGRKSCFFIPLAFDARRIIDIPFGAKKLKWWGTSNFWYTQKLEVLGYKSVLTV